MKFKFFPATGFTPLSVGLGENLHTMFLPALTISGVLFATYTRLLRADMAEQIVTEDYVTAASLQRDSARPRDTDKAGNVLCNSLSLITVVGVNFGTLLGGNAIVESVFSLPGMGQLLVLSINSRDANSVQGIVLLLAVAGRAGELVDRCPIRAIVTRGFTMAALLDDVDFHRPARRDCHEPSYAAHLVGDLGSLR